MIASNKILDHHEKTVLSCIAQRRHIGLEVTGSDIEQTLGMSPHAVAAVLASLQRKKIVRFKVGQKFRGRDEPLMLINETEKADE